MGIINKLMTQQLKFSRIYKDSSLTNYTYQLHPLPPQYYITIITKTQHPYYVLS